MGESTGLSRSVEDYLKAIFNLTEGGGAASTSALAQVLDIQPASVTGMIKRLAESGLLEHMPYHGVRLTEGGTREALRVIRRHRILESYLAQHLSYSWDDVHEEAERLEHAASDELIERMASALKDPSHDPHGAPIPTSGGEIEATGHYTLAETERGDSVHIRAVRDEDAERLRYMEAQGLIPGAEIRVEERAPFNGPLTLRIGGQGGPTRVVGHELARRIFVNAIRPGQSR